MLYAEQRNDGIRGLVQAADGSQQPETLPRTLSSRLIFIFFATVLALILATSAILYWAAVEALQYADDQVVEKRMLAVAGHLGARELNEGMVAHEVEEDNQGPRQIFIRVISSYAPLALESHNMNVELPAALFVDAAAAPLGELRRSSIVSSRGETFRALSARVPVTGGPEPGTAVIQVATDTSLDADGLAWFRRLLSGVLAAAVPLSGFVSWLLVKRELKPLERITHAAQAVDSSSMDKRMTLSGLPRELRDLGSQFNSMLDRIEESCTELKTYADTIAHEMRTPLNRMRLQSEIAIHEASTADDLRTVVTGNIEECERLGRLLQGLLFLARADSHHAVLRPKELHLATELATIGEFFEASASAAGSRIETTCPDQIHISADRELFQHAVGNLLSNAIAHTPEGGHIAVHATGGENGRDVMISVRDTGNGIAEQHHGRIFDRFYRATMSGVETAEALGGGRLGLGLSIVKSIAELHGGGVSMCSVPGAGTTFTVRLPAFKADAGAAIAELRRSSQLH